MHPKQLLPLALRDPLRPTYQRLRRVWQESALSPKPAEWREARVRMHASTVFDDLYRTAGEGFGITQIYDEIEQLIELVRSEAPQVVVEIGTHKGGNSFIFCHALPTVELVVGLDLNVQNAAKLKYCVRQGQRYIALHGDSQTQAQRSRLEHVLKGRSIDFLFIDGDHSYAGARADYELYAPLVRPGGLIAFHDIIPDHATRFGKQTGCWTGEVYRLWAEVRELHPEHFELVSDAEQDGFGIGVVRVPMKGAA
ncbi:hypothetical protein CKO25_10550 [Thiocapsa imhoffii]|uniref:Class I SAM-dependent methyltransferase n=1 Tax=Thiocapsa imhoffii TaxID=382777 RepID=A0A9X0WIV6_9GAMM|nr:hypothetical protein [Thiocapsa imhoffii]